MPSIPRLAARYFLTGRPILNDGDNATLLHGATIDYRARPYITLSRPRWQRLARRHVAITAPTALLLAAPLTPVEAWWAGAYEAALTAGAVAWGTRRLMLNIRDRRRYREWIDPAAKRLARILKANYSRKLGRSWIHLPRDWGTDRADGERQSAMIYLPPGTVLSANIKRSITENVGAALGIPAPISADWAENGSRVELFAAPLPPKELKFSEMRKAIEECPDDEIVLGRRAGGHIVRVSLAEDAPHIALSGAAGSGKSVLVRFILWQRILRGDGIFIFDPKRFSHMRWAAGFSKDRVRYAVTDVELHEGWLAVAEEMRRRIGLPLDELEKQRRVWLCAEEINAQIKILTRYWKVRRQEIMRPARALLADCEKECGGSKVEGLALAMDRGLDLAELDPPAISPAVVAMQESVFMGRELKMHVLAAAQRLSAGVFGGGGGDVRESFQGGRLMAKWDRKLWKMLADGIPYVAWPGGPRGNWGLAKGDEFFIFRAPWIDEREMAMASQLASPVRGPVLGRQLATGQIEGMASGQSDGQLANGQRAGQLAITSAVTLAMAIDELPGQSGPMAISLRGLRDAAANAAGFPAPLAKPDGQEYGLREARLYDLGELKEWRAGVLAAAGKNSRSA